jgi:hypothetical protein
MDFIEKNEYGKLNILGDFIRVNNTFKGLFTEIMLDIITTKPEETFVEFLKIMLTSFGHKRNEHYSKCFEKYFVAYEGIIIDDETDKNYLYNRKNLQMLYDLLAKGGMYYPKGNKVLSILSLFFKSEEITEEEFGLEVQDELLKTYDYVELKLSFPTVANLVKLNYLNYNHLVVKLKHLLPRDFYIPKKKRKKRIYTEEKSYKYIPVKDLPTLDKFYTKSSYSIETDKIMRDKNSRRKVYIPKPKNPEKVKRVFKRVTLKNESLLSITLSTLADNSNI